MDTTTTPTTANARSSSAKGRRTAARPRFLALAAALAAAGCFQPRLLTGLRYHEASAGFSNGSPWSVEQIVKRFPALEGIVITAPDFLLEQERMRREREKEGSLSAAEEYRLTAGASIRVEIAGEEDLNRDFTIGPTGYIDYPYIGEIQAKDRTLRDMREEIRAKLTEIVRDPKVSINLVTLPSISATQVTAGDILVITQGSSQTFNYTGDETVAQVLASVNAITDEHEWRQVRVIRRPGPGTPGRFVLVDMWRLLNMADLRQDIPLAAGDIIYVPRHWTIGEQFNQDLDLLLKYFDNTYQIDDFVKYLESKK